MLPRTPKPDATDLLILGAVAWSTRKSLASVANATGLSAKTVRRRLDRMIEGATLGTGLFLDFRAVKGTLVCDLCVTYKDEKLKADVDRRILSFVGDRLFPPVYPQSVGIFRLLLRSPNEQRDLLRRVKSLEGVSSAFVDVLVEDFYVVETFYAMERRMLEEMAAENRLDPKARRLWKAAWGLSTDVLYPRDFGTRGSRSS
jgi:DNA-binding Lrp family transcriptional regulator